MERVGLVTLDTSRRRTDTLRHDAAPRSQLIVSHGAKEFPTMAELAQIGVTGLAVMGRNLARNFARHGHRVAIHNRSYARTESLIAEAGSEGTFVPSESMADFVASLERPRRVLIMVKAGPGTDA